MVVVLLVGILVQPGVLGSRALERVLCDIPLLLEDIAAQQDDDVDQEHVQEQLPEGRQPAVVPVGDLFLLLGEERVLLVLLDEAEHLLGDHILLGEHFHGEARLLVDAAVRVRLDVEHVVDGVLGRRCSELEFDVADLDQGGDLLEGGHVLVGLVVEDHHPSLGLGVREPRGMGRHRGQLGRVLRGQVVLDDEAVLVELQGLGRHLLLLGLVSGIEGPGIPAQMHRHGQEVTLDDLVGALDKVGAGHAQARELAADGVHLPDLVGGVGAQYTGQHVQALGRAHGHQAVQARDLEALQRPEVALLKMRQLEQVRVHVGELLGKALRQVHDLQGRPEVVLGQGHLQHLG